MKIELSSKICMKFSLFYMCTDFTSIQGKFTNNKCFKSQMVMRKYICQLDSIKPLFINSCGEFCIGLSFLRRTNPVVT